MIETLTASESLSAPNKPRIPPTISRTHDNARSDMIVAAAPVAMNGVRFPHFDLQLSLRIPTYGCTRAPERGPAIQTKAMIDLLRPNDNKYGVPFDNSTAHASCNPPILIVKSIRYQMDFDSGSWLLPSRVDSSSISPSCSSSPASDAESKGDCSWTGFVLSYAGGSWATRDPFSPNSSSRVLDCSPSAMIMYSGPAVEFAGLFNTEKAGVA